MEKMIQQLKENNIPFLEQEELKKWCTFRIGGSTPLFIEPKTNEQVAIIVTICRDNSIPFLILGRGSNILFGDNGYSGVVIHLGKLFSNMDYLGNGKIYCQSGALLTDLCQFALSHDLTGMEQLFGIPGSVGGAVFMNAGAYGGETKDIVVSSTYVDLDGNIGEITVDEMDMSYRHSIYTENHWVITGMTIQLVEGNPIEIKERMDDYMGRRREKQPLEYASAGSTFKRPEGHYASALIDECGLKGTQVGDAMVSTKHAGFVINTQDATCQDVLAVIKRVQDTVWKEKNVILEREIILIDQ